MNAPAIAAVVLVAVALIVIGFVATIVIASGQSSRWVNPDGGEEVRVS